MKNAINYLYNFNIDNLRMINNNYYFVYRNNQYILQEIKGTGFSYNAIYELNKRLSNNNMFYRIFLNKNNEIVSVINNKKYILLIDNSVEDREFDIFDILNTHIDLDNNTKKDKLLNELNRFDWVKLWTRKIDYFESYMIHNSAKYLKLNKYINYFVGLGENAISYAMDTLDEIKPGFSDRLVISHKRIDIKNGLKDLYNPLNLIVDHPSRDIAEYFKMLLIAQPQKINDVIDDLSMINLTNYGVRLLMSRMLFPSFFFDSFENFIDEKVDFYDIVKLVEKMNSYEEKLYKIYATIKNQYSLPEINWLKKVDYSSTFTTPNTSGTSFINNASMPSFNVISSMLQ